LCALVGQINGLNNVQNINVTQFDPMIEHPKLGIATLNTEAMIEDVSAVTMTNASGFF